MGRYNKYTSAFTALTSGLQTMYDRITANGARIIKDFSDFGDDWKYVAAASGIVNTTTAVTIKAAAGAGVKNYITALHISHATLGAATEIAIRDGAGGTVLWRGTLGTVANEGAGVYFPTPLAGSANTLLEVVTLTAVTGGVYANAQGFVGP